MTRAMVLLLAIGLLGGSGCVAARANASAEASPPVIEYHLDARQFGFYPNVVTVPAGARVRLVVTSDDVDHRLKITGLEPEQETVDGRVQTIELTAWPPGRYEFTCAAICGTSGSHSQMSGSLVVE